MENAMAGVSGPQSFQLLAVTFHGSPWNVRGSPWKVRRSPWSVRGCPWNMTVDAVKVRQHYRGAPSTRQKIYLPIPCCEATVRKGMRG